MTSAKQRAANRSNAASSSGPRSPEGKQNSSMNALGHGGTAALGVLPDEDPQEAIQFSQRLHEAYAPCGPDQEILVQLIVDGLRRLQRLSRVESGILTWHLYEKLQDRVGQTGEGQRPDGGTESVAYKKSQLRQRQAMDVDLAAQAFLHDAHGPDALGKLSRYETAIANRVMGWMKELRQLQSDQVNPA